MLSKKFGVLFLLWGKQKMQVWLKRALVPLLAPQLIRKTINAESVFAPVEVHGCLRG